MQEMQVLDPEIWSGTIEIWSGTIAHRDAGHCFARTGTNHQVGAWTDVTIHKKNQFLDQYKDQPPGEIQEWKKEQKNGKFSQRMNKQGLDSRGARFTSKAWVRLCKFEIIEEKIETKLE